MHILWIIPIGALRATPAQAGDWRSQVVATETGAFVGGRVSVSLGGKAPGKPRAALAIAPTQSRFSADGTVRTRIAEGAALNLTGAKPTLTFAGVRADTALGINSGKPIAPQGKQGISTTGWVAVGAGVVVVAGLVAFALWVDAVEDSGD